mmetsp:Transcript_20126/g.77172  ORF Transcript_20126/g.77172 Transcript_20126/m.77172 type:complete len:388 (+) Transcript_20126:880-2043(+)
MQSACLGLERLLRERQLLVGRPELGQQLVVPLLLVSAARGRCSRCTACSPPGAFVLLEEEEKRAPLQSSVVLTQRLVVRHGFSKAVLQVLPLGLQGGCRFRGCLRLHQTLLVPGRWHRMPVAPATGIPPTELGVGIGFGVAGPNKSARSDRGSLAVQLAVPPVSVHPICGSGCLLLLLAARLGACRLTAGQGAGRVATRRVLLPASVRWATRVTIRTVLQPRVRLGCRVATRAVFWVRCGRACVERCHNLTGSLFVRQHVGARPPDSSRSLSCGECPAKPACRESAPQSHPHGSSPHRCQHVEQRVSRRLFQAGREPALHLTHHGERQAGREDDRVSSLVGGRWESNCGHALSVESHRDQGGSGPGPEGHAGFLCITHTGGRLACLL